MLIMYIGLNGKGKTVNIWNMYDKLISEGHSVVTNLKESNYYGFNPDRLKILTSEWAHEEVFDYGEVVTSENSIMISSDFINISNNCTELLKLICRRGDILILDEPAKELSDSEIMIFHRLMERIKETYAKIIMVTHCQYLFSLADKIFWVEGYDCTEISEEELYNHVGSVRG